MFALRAALEDVYIGIVCFGENADFGIHVTPLEMYARAASRLHVPTTRVVK